MIHGFWILANMTQVMTWIQTKGWVNLSQTNPATRAGKSGPKMCHSMPNVPLVNLSLKLIWFVGLGLAKEKKGRPLIIVNEIGLSSICGWSSYIDSMCLKLVWSVHAPGKTVKLICKFWHGYAKILCGVLAFSTCVKYHINLNMSRLNLPPQTTQGSCSAS